jgi:hypothetical protein
MIYEPMVRLAQTMTLSCTDTNTVSKWSKMRFHNTHVTLEFNWVCLKWFLRLWYVRRKSCTYLTSRLVLSLNGPKQASTWALLPWSTVGCFQNNFYVDGMFGTNHAPIVTLSPNGLKRDSMWPTSPTSSIGCVQNDFRAYGTSGANRAPILCQDYQYLETDRIELPLEPRHLGVPTDASKMISEHCYVWRKLSTYLVWPLTLSPNRSKQDSMWPISLRSSIWCV